MTPHAPDHLTQDPSTTRTRVKWDNIAIVLFGIVIASFAVVGILASGDSTPSTSGTPKPSPTTTAPALDAAASDTALTAEDARGLVDESRSLMGEARWDEAADRLAMVPAEFRDTVGAPALEEELAGSRATHDRLRAELTAAVEAKQWKPALALLVQLEKIAVLDTDLMDIRATATRALRPKAAADAAVDGTDPEADPSTVTGGGASANPTTKPAAQSAKPKPATQTTKPAPATETTKPAADPSTAITGALGAQLTPAQQQELEDALSAFGTGDLGDLEDIS